jgi:hypothetical protein
MKIFFTIKLLGLLLLSTLRNIQFVILVLIFLSCSSIFLLQKVGFLSAQLITAASALNAQKLKHKVELKKALAKEKVKSRMRQAIVAVPFVGSVAFAAMELNDFQLWKKENPGKTESDYACETVQLSAEVLEDVLAELPNVTKGDIDQRFLSFVGDCNSSEKP